MNILIALIVIIILCYIVYYIDYKMVVVTKYKVKDKKIPKSFDGFKILHLSDWHETEYGKENRKLISLINSQDVDIIVITGDCIIRQKGDMDKTLDFIKKIQKDNVKIYFSFGNHEITLREKIYKLWSELEKIGVIVLDKSHTSISRNGEEIEIYGLRYDTDSQHNRKTLTKDVINYRTEWYKNAFDHIDKNKFNIFLMHDPLYYKSYMDAGFDLVYSGHLHGGGVRVFGLGVATPWKKYWFTTLASGMKKRNGKRIIISRGIGNSTIPIRVFNIPEISITTLKHED